MQAPSQVRTTEYVEAPEVILKGSPITTAIDMWALGVVCMGLVCGSLVVWRDRKHDAAHPDLLMRVIRQTHPKSSVLGSAC